MNSDNVKIPLSLLNDTVNVLECFYRNVYIQNLAPDFIAYFQSVLVELQLKQRSLDLRVAYSKIVSAKTETERNNARIDYLRLKQETDFLY